MFALQPKPLTLFAAELNSLAHRMITAERYDVYVEVAIFRQRLQREFPEMIWTSGNSEAEYVA